jgi:hypothetical protein
MINVMNTDNHISAEMDLIPVKLTNSVKKLNFSFYGLK